MSDVLASIDVARRLGQTEVAERSGSGSGAAFPTSVASGFRFFRTDLGIEASYDGARWLSQPFVIPYPPYNVLTGTGSNVTALCAWLALDGQYDYWVDRCVLKCYSTVAGTGLANYHAVWFSLAANGYPSVYGVTLDTIAANTWTSYDGTPTTQVWPRSNLYSLLQLQKVGTAAGVVFVMGSIRARLIVT